MIYKLKVIDADEDIYFDVVGTAPTIPNNNWSSVIRNCSWDTDNDVNRYSSSSGILYYDSSTGDAYFDTPLSLSQSKEIYFYALGSIY